MPQTAYETSLKAAARARCVRRSGHPSLPSAGSSLRAPLLWLLLPHLGGIACASCLPGPFRHPVPLLLGGLIAAGTGCWVTWWTRFNRPGWLLGSIVIAGLAGGAGSLLLREPPTRWSGPPREVTVDLEIAEVFADAPTARTWRGLGLVRSATGPAAPLSGQCLYFSASRRFSLPPMRTGRYEVNGVVQLRADASGLAPGFDHYLAGRGIELTLTRARVSREIAPPGRTARFLAAAAARCESILRHGVERHRAEVGIYLGMLLGERAALSQEVHDAFTRSGTFHVFVVAGLHVGIIAEAIFCVLAALRLPPRVAAAAGLALLWTYVEITGGGLPAHRAFTMIAFLRGARVLRQPGNPLAALALAAFVTVLWDPHQLFSAGFQLSYPVVTALVVMGGPLGESWKHAWSPWRSLPEADWGWHRRFVTDLGKRVLGGLATSATALIASVPVMIADFGVLSPGSLLANLAVIPMAATVISAGFASLVCGFAGLFALSSLFNHAAVLTIRAMTALVGRAAGLPGVAVVASFAADWLGPATLALVLAAMLHGASRRWRPEAGGFWPPVAALALAVILGVNFG